MSDSYLDQLQQGVEAMGLNVTEFPLQDYLSYIELLVQWNSAYNLKPRLLKMQRACLVNPCKENTA